MRLQETISVRNNLRITTRERGKIAARREGHNIWLDLGREYLASLISLVSYGPDTPERNDRIKYMGFGIGGTRQVAPGVANAAPLVTAYPGTNVWLGTIQAPPIHTTATEVTFRRLFSQTEISYSSYTTVPLSEVMLFTSAANPIGQPFNTGVAYDTFDTISKTGAFELEVE